MKKFAIAAAVVIVAAFAAPAFASMNPFMDVPASHWAYDAVAQLAARGVISGYPDGTYKGAQPATRYEMASALARALAAVDMEKASKQDVEMLKRLIVEFKDELDALGVKVDKLDERVKVIESDIGGWSISGEFRFDAKFTNNESGGSYWGEVYTVLRGKNEFDLNRYRIFLKKRINETTSFTARLGRFGNPTDGSGRANVKWEQYYIDTKLGYDVKMRVGLFPVNWDGEYGLYNVVDPWIDDMHIAGFLFSKEWGKARVELAISRQNDDVGLGGQIAIDPALSQNEIAELQAGLYSSYEALMISALVHYDFSEKFDAGIIAYFQFGSGEEEPYYMDGANKVEFDTKRTTIGAFLRFRFTPGVELKGVYYHQKFGEDFVFANGVREDKAKAWKIILDAKQDVLKFTSLWAEYGQMDNYFAPTNNDIYGDFGSAILVYRPFNDNTSKILRLRADQKWNGKWRTFLRYIQIDYDTEYYYKAKEWGLGVGYRLNPAVEFELSYNNINYGMHGRDIEWSDENLIRFRTFVTF